MKTIFGISFTWLRAARPAVLALSLPVLAAVGAGAQTTPTTPRAEFENSVITSTTNAINATRVPVLNSEGVLTYQDITFTVDVDDNGVVTFAPMSTIASSNPLNTDHFVGGTYYGPGGSPVITVSSPGVAPGGATMWSLAQSGTAACAYPYTANWYVGPISDSPLAARLKNAKITSTAYSYGILGQYGGCGYNGNWGTGALLGFSQTGKSITIVSFSSYSTDNSVPVAQITYTSK